MATAEVAGTEAGGDQAAELAKQLQNPVASLISLPFQSNFDFNAWVRTTTDSVTRSTFSRLVIPVSLGKDFNLIIQYTSCRSSRRLM